MEAPASALAQARASPPRSLSFAQRSRSAAAGLVDPATIAEISSAYGAFFDGIETKWSPGELLFKHPPLVVFGNEILSEGKHLEDFKPKDKC